MFKAEVFVFALSVKKECGSGEIARFMAVDAAKAATIARAMLKALGVKKEQATLVRVTDKEGKPVMAPLCLNE